MAGLESLFRRQADYTADRSPLYHVLCSAAADALAADPDHAVARVLRRGLPGGIPDSAEAPLRLLGAVHYRMLGGPTRDPGRQLARYYPSAAGAAARPPDPRAGALFLELLEAEEAALSDLVRHNPVQTNEVGRCGALLVAFHRAAREAGADAPLHLLELGASAGLNLAWDRYAYQYRLPDGGAVRWPGDHAPGEAPVLEVRVEGDPPAALAELPAWRPRVATRVGMDRDPVDARDPDGARWLQAFVWPDQGDRLRRLRRALDAFADARPPVALRRAELPRDLAPGTAAAVGRGALVIFNSVFAYYLSREEVGELRRRVAAIARARRRDGPTYWVELEAAAPDASAPDLALWRAEGGALEREVVARSEWHGAKLTF